MQADGEKQLHRRSHVESRAQKVVRLGWTKALFPTGLARPGQQQLN